MNRPSKIGSSLVLVVVVMAGIIIVVFGASRLTLVQYNQANRDEDNVFALYAAKAGIEDGLLRYRYNRNAETTDTKVARYNLTTGTSAGEVAEGSKTLNFTKPTDQYYDMKLNFRVQSLGDFDFSPDPFSVTPKPILAKDDFLEISGFEEKSSLYYLRVAFKFYEPVTHAACSNPNALVQIQRVVEGISNPYEQITAKPTNDRYDSLGSSNIEVNLINPSRLATTFRVRPYYCDVAYAIATTTDINGRGVDNDGKKTSDAGLLFGGLKSYITSTGYYGEAKRTLIGEIDRISGQLISIYDFNLYSGEGNIRP
ncbi:MAG: hypothetical protein AAB669_03325 [Patescibacteria group bacterium]